MIATRAKWTRHASRPKSRTETAVPGCANARSTGRAPDLGAPMCPETMSSHHEYPVTSFAKNLTDMVRNRPPRPIQPCGKSKALTVHSQTMATTVQCEPHQMGKGTSPISSSCDVASVGACTRPARPNKVSVDILVLSKITSTRVRFSLHIQGCHIHPLAASHPVFPLWVLRRKIESSRWAAERAGRRTPGISALAHHGATWRSMVQLPTRRSEDLKLRLGTL